MCDCHPISKQRVVSVVSFNQVSRRMQYTILYTVCTQYVAAECVDILCEQLICI